jgi:hypothetical protein
VCTLQNELYTNGLSSAVANPLLCALLLLLSLFCLYSVMLHMMCYSTLCQYTRVLLSADVCILYTAVCGTTGQHQQCMHASSEK